MQNSIATIPSFMIQMFLKTDLRQLLFSTFIKNLFFPRRAQPFFFYFNRFKLIADGKPIIQEEINTKYFTRS